MTVAMFGKGIKNWGKNGEIAYQSCHNFKVYYCCRLPSIVVYNKSSTVLELFLLTSVRPTTEKLPANTLLIVLSRNQNHADRRLCNADIEEAGIRYEWLESFGRRVA